MPHIVVVVCVRKTVQKDRLPNSATDRPTNRLTNWPTKRQSGSNYLWAGKYFKNFVLDLFQPFLVGGTLNYQLVLLLFQFRLLFRSDDAQQLVLKTLRSDHEVEEYHLHWDLRQIVWVTHSCRDVETKIFWVLNDVITKLHILHALHIVSIVLAKVLIKVVRKTWLIIIYNVNVNNPPAEMHITSNDLLLCLLIISWII